jgi:hypothetical protein
VQQQVVRHLVLHPIVMDGRLELLQKRVDALALEHV